MFFIKGGGAYECARNKPVEPVLTGKPRSGTPPEKNQSVFPFGTSNGTSRIDFAKILI